MFPLLKRRDLLCLIAERIIHLENKNEENNLSSRGLHILGSSVLFRNGAQMKFYEASEHCLKESHLYGSPKSHQMAKE